MSDAIPPPPWRAQQGGGDSSAIPPPPWKQGGAAKPETSTLDSLWEGVKNFGAGVGRGIAGQGVPTGKASEDPGGRSEFGGRMVGAGARSVIEGLWDAIKTPGQVAAGEKQPTVENALPTAMLMVGQGGRRPMVTEAAGEPAAVARTLQNQAGGGPNPFQPAGAGRVEPQQPVGVQPQIRQQPPNLPMSGQVPGPQRPGVPAPQGGAARPAVPVQPQIRQQPTSAPIPGGAGQAMPPARPGTPAPPGGSISDATVSPLTEAIVRGDGNAVDRALVGTYKTAVRPGRLPREQRTAAGSNAQDRRIMTAVDGLIADRPALRVSGPNGMQIPLPDRPSLVQFSEALDQRAAKVFHEYDDKARLAGERGVEVPLAPVVKALRTVAKQSDVADLHPSIATEANRVADLWEKRGSMPPSEAQDMIQSLNKTVGQGVYSSIVDHKGVANAARQALLTELNKTIDNAKIPGYQATRNQYRAIAAIKQDVANAVEREAKRQAGTGLAGLANLVSGAELLHGIFFMSPEHMATAGAMKAAQMAIRYVNEPNRAIGRMFARRALETQRTPYSPGRSSFGQMPLTRGAGPTWEGLGYDAAGTAQFGAPQKDETGPLGGKIISQRSVQRPNSGYPTP